MIADLGDVRMYYEVSGNEFGDWLILIHGLAGSTKCWKLQIEDFNQHFRVLNIDLVGHGQSSGSANQRYSGEIIANHIRLLMDKLKIQKAHLLGLSLGTIVQQFFCEIFPDRVISTIYASPVTKFNKVSGFFNGFSDKVFLKLFKKDVYLKFMGHLMLPGKIHEKSRHFFLQETLKMSDAEFKKWWRLVMEGNHFDYISKSNVPALMIAGEKDFCFFKDSVLLMEKYTQSEMKVIKGVGHVTVFQSPQEFNSLVIAYTQSLKNKSNMPKDIEKTYPVAANA